MNKYLTVVYTIKDDEAFKEERARLMEQFEELGDKPYGITAVSSDHEIRRVEFMTEAAENMLYDLHVTIGEIAAHADIGNVKSLAPTFVEECELAN